MDEYVSLFPLEVVLLPEMVLPLHIFEERYKEMVGECLRLKKQFGVLYVHDETVEQIGCLAEITEVTKTYDDGRLDIVTVGRDRFELVYLDSERSFLRGMTTPFMDEQPLDLPTEEDATGLLKQSEEVYRLLTKTSTEGSGLSASSGSYEGLSFRIASLLNLGNPVKQQMLAERSEKNRIGTLSNHLAELLSHLQQIEQGMRKARNNGKLV